MKKLFFPVLTNNQENLYYPVVVSAGKILLMNMLLKTELIEQWQANMENAMESLQVFSVIKSTDKRMNALSSQDQHRFP